MACLQKGRGWAAQWRTFLPMRLSRRSFLRGVGGAAVLGAAGPWLPRLATAGGPADPDAGTGFSLGVASFDPTPDGVILWTRLDEGLGDAVEVQLATDPHFTTAGAWTTAMPTGDRTFQLALDGLPEGTTFWYRFRTPDGLHQSAPGRTRTAPADPNQLRLAVTSCQDWQMGLYNPWSDVAAHDLDAVVFLGDYIYEYGTYGPDSPYNHGRTRHVRQHLDPAGSPVPEAIALDEYRLLYRLYRSDPQLRAAHRAHPWIVVWDDHEGAGDRWSTGAVNHGDNAPGAGGGHDDPREDPESAEFVPWDMRLANGVQAYREYLPGRYQEIDGFGGTAVYRHLSFGGLADLLMLDSRTFRDEGVGGSNRNFNPFNNRDVPEISAEGRTILGAAQKQWLKDRLAGSSAAWKLIGNQMMMSPLNLVNLPDAIGKAVADATQSEQAEPLPVTYHRDGLPVNTDQWDGYQHERRELLSFLRYGNEAPASEAERHLADVVPTGSHVADAVFLTGDIHIGWVTEVTLDWGDAPADEPVAAELVCPGISSENFNERIGDLTGVGGPLPHGTTAAAGPATLAMNRHVRYVDFDSNGWTLVEVSSDRVRATQKVLANPLGTDPRVNPAANPDAVMTDAPHGRWEVHRGSSRVRPALG